MDRKHMLARFSLSFASRLAFAIPLLSLATGALADRDPCKKEMEGRGEMRGEFRVELSEITKIEDPAEQEAATLSLRKRVRSPYERGAAELALGVIYTRQNRPDEARPLLEAVVRNAYMARIQTDAAHGLLARIALQQGEPDKAIAHLEPIIAADCGVVDRDHVFLLSYAYAQTGRRDDALKLLNPMELRNTQDEERWLLLRLELQCGQPGVEACAERWYETVSMHGNSDRIRGRLAAFAEALSAHPEAAAKLDEARREGLLLQNGAVAALPGEEYVELEAIQSVTPEYPPAAIKSGISGYAKVKVEVDEHGRVKSATIVDASPKKIFDDAALEAARKSTFKPALIHGKPAETSGFKTYTFMIGPTALK